MSFELLPKIVGLRRDIVSDGFDQALEEIKAFLPIKVWGIESGTKIFSWVVPKKWSVKEAWIKFKGKKIVDIKNHGLHLMSYSVPIHAKMSLEELKPRLFCDKNYPDAIPFKFSYYAPRWGFCLPCNDLEALEEGEYEVFVDSSFEGGKLKVGEFEIKGKSKQTVLLLAHLCHPYMANDGLSGVAVLVEVAKALEKRETNYSYRFLFLPEIIGSIAYLAGHSKEVPFFKYALFAEMLGNDAPLALQFSRQRYTCIDLAAERVLPEFGCLKTGRFGSIVVNDDFCVNFPGIDIPCVSVSRSNGVDNEHCFGYHTSLDSIERIRRDKLNEAVDAILGTLLELDAGFDERDYYPLRKFFGPVFLTGYGLWQEPWVIDRTQRADRLMCMLEGQFCVSDIAMTTGVGFPKTFDYLEKFYEKGLIERNEARK